MTKKLLLIAALIVVVFLMMVPSFDIRDPQEDASNCAICNLDDHLASADCTSAITLPLPTLTIALYFLFTFLSHPFFTLIQGHNRAPPRPIHFF